MNHRPSATLFGLLLVAAGLIALVAVQQRPSEAAPPDDVIVIRDGHRVRVDADFDSAEFERQLSSTLESALSGLEGLERLGELDHMDGLHHLDRLEHFGVHMEGLGERVSRAVERALHGLEMPAHVRGHGRVEVDFDADRFERHMERLAESLEHSLPRGALDRDERHLRRELKRLERELEELREELQELREEDI